MNANAALVRRHLRIGWWTLLLFMTLGVALEAMHGFKLELYLSVENETRRLMWRLAHAHGGLIALVHVAYAATLATRAKDQDTSWCRPAGNLLIVSQILLPGGFLLGGLVVYGGDPWLGVGLVPVGALVFLIGVFRIARRL